VDYSSTLPEEDLSIEGKEALIFAKASSTAIIASLNEIKSFQVCHNFN
jgi:hypothetical protein